MESTSQDSVAAKPEPSDLPETESLPSTSTEVEVSSETADKPSPIEPWGKPDTILAKILTEGFFHSDEVWEDAQTEKWYGLFQNKNGFYLQQTNLETERYYDPIIDEDESEKTGWKVSTSNQDTSVVLISSTDLIKSRKVEAVTLSKQEIWPGNKVTFTYKGNPYTLQATGKKKRSDAGSDYYIVSNYKLFLSTIKNGQEVKQLLVESRFFDDAMIYIRFVGDLDGDSFPDFLIDRSNDYNGSNPSLFLSTPAKNGSLLKMVGTHESVGC
ncbi:hypothetical protein FOA19_05080 [Rufibacter hautae]|uniref:Uncharacterized protein n=2 Tax=Rufibacter hautae TaxID=2595005 RepID=A0A5B6TH90_9BACT|nr:hypothetical protein FOA19_05080 [Rufibacter hautae]